MNIIKIYFDTERRRDLFARKRRRVAFLETYSDKTNIKDINTLSFWDKRIVKEYKNLPESPIYRDKIKLVADFISRKTGKILDIGFGYGHLERELLKVKSLQIYGLDLSKSAVKRIKKEMKGNFRVGNILKLPYKASMFDCVAALDVLEHIPPEKIFKAYEELYRVLKKGGFLVVSVPLNEGLEKKLEKGKNPGAHLREYTPDIIKYEMEISGFKILDEDYLYAFGNNYLLKKLLIKILPFRIRESNQIIIYLQKK